MDKYNTSRSSNGFPKLNPFSDELYINDFNHSLESVLEEFCIKRGFSFTIVSQSCAIISAPQEEYEKYIEQLKLFYL